MATLKNTLIDDTGYLQLPVGTTAQRPGSPVSGDMRWNTDNSNVEVYNGTSWVGVSYQVPLVPVTSGLIAYLQADVPSSYGGSGTTWYDLSGNNTNGTLQNGVAYNTSDGYYFNFDGSNDRVDISLGATAAMSVVTVAKSNTSTWNTWGQPSSARTNNGYIFHGNNGASTITWYWRNAGNSAWTAAGPTTVSNIQDWNVYAGSTNGSTNNLWYLNGSQVASTTSNAGRSGTYNTTFYIGLDNCCGSRYGNIRVHAHLIYNRQLTAAEMSSISSYYLNKLP